MKQLISTLVAVAIAGTAAAQTSPTTSPTTVDGYVAVAKVAAGTDWAGTFLRLCIPPPASAQAGRGAGGRGGAPRVPDREKWYAEPAKVADNLYFLGTKVHSAWAVVGSEGIIIIEALFDYAAKDEILDGMKKLGLDQSKVKYVLLSHAHADHDGGAKLLQDSLPGAHLIYGSEDWDAIDKAATHAEVNRSATRRATTEWWCRWAMLRSGSLRCRAHAWNAFYLFEVKDQGKPMRIAYVGGTAIPFNASPAWYDTYVGSSKKMAKAAAE